MNEPNVTKNTILCLNALVFSAALFLRMAVSLSTYSGAGRPPMYGDCEAQRHWMEITYNLRINDWYKNTSENNLLYWGLDYPPLTAYHSWLCGIVAHYLNPEWVALNTSHGYESYEHKLYMRYTVLAVDVLVFFTAVFTYVTQLVFTGKAAAKEDYIEQNIVIFLLLFQPGLILIDHGHFQYNCVSLGLTLWGIVGIILNYDVLGSVAFTLALNYKQMELYHALPFFFYLLGKALQHSWQTTILKVVKLGITVLGTFLVCWSLLLFAGGLSSAFDVFHRMFPFNRGLYEDKVANFWCSISILLKVKQILSQRILILLSSGMTILFSLPSSISLLRNPNPYYFLLSLVNSSLSFFLFSFQVHEKSILLAVLPVSLLTPHHPYLAVWFNMAAVFSMYPLLVKDGLALGTWALTSLFCLCSVVTLKLSFKILHWLEQALFVFSTIAVLSLCALSHIISPPSKLPDIFPVLISTSSCAIFILFFIYFNWLQLFGMVKCINLTEGKPTSRIYQVARYNINLVLSHPVEKEHAD